MYKLIKDRLSETIKSVQRLSDTAFIPFDPANTDYAEFKIDVAEGSELQDSEGVVMSSEAAQAFVATLP
jgi:hypothetical protein